MSKTTRASRLAPDQAGDAVELFPAVEVDDDLPALGAFDLDQHGGAEPRVQVLLQLQHVGGLTGTGGRFRVRRVLADAGPGGGRRARGDEGLGLSDGEALDDHALTGGALGV